MLWRSVWNHLRKRTFAKRSRKVSLIICPAKGSHSILARIPLKIRICGLCTVYFAMLVSLLLGSRKRKDIEAQLELARTTLSRAWGLYAPAGTSPNADAWERNVAEFRTKIAELRRRVHIYNLKAPSTIFHKRQMDPDALIEEVKTGKLGS